MTQAAKRAAELANAEYAGVTKYRPIDFEDDHAIGADSVAFRKFIKHVSDVAKRVQDAGKAYDKVCGAPVGGPEFIVFCRANDDLRALILPDDADPLAEAIKGASITGRPVTWEEQASALRAELAARGLCIAPVKGGDRG